MPVRLTPGGEDELQRLHPSDPEHGSLSGLPSELLILFLLPCLHMLKLKDFALLYKEMQQ